MLTSANLHLLQENLQQASATRYFGSRYVDYTDTLLRLVTHIIENRASYNEDVLRAAIDRIWMSHSYLAGSTKNDIPFELEFSLRTALQGWTREDLLIATALVDGRTAYHFRKIGVLSELKTLIPDFDYHGFSAQVVHIAIPHIYRKSPLLGLPLYHEIGHYIDHAYGISGYAFMRAAADYDGFLGRNPHFHPDELRRFSRESKLGVLERYLAEHFADLFSACYLGSTGTDFLLDLVGHGPPSGGHPAVDDRIHVVDDFIAGRQNELVELFQEVLHKLGLPRLTLLYGVPDIAPSYDNLRPYVISTVEELHGIYGAAYTYLRKALEERPEAWISGSDEETIAAVNDLTEKSIRNFAIGRNWTDAAT